MRRWLVAGALMLVVLSAHVGHAQTRPVSIRQVSDEGGGLTVVATLLDEGGRPVAGVLADAFEVQIDGSVAPVQDVRFAADPQTGLGLVIAIDVSGSMQGARIERARAAAAAFLDTLGPTDQVALVAFNEEVAFFHDFTGDRAAVKATIQRLGANGNTALYRATEAAVTKAASSSLPRKAVVLISDGENADPTGRVSRDAALATVRGAGVPIYSIGLGAEVDRPYLDQLAQLSHGQTQHAPTPADLDRLYRGIGDALRGQYVVRAQPAPVRRAPSHTVRLTIRLNGAAATDEVAFAGAGLALLPDPTPQPTAQPAPQPAPMAVATPPPLATPSVAINEAPPSSREATESAAASENSARGRGPALPLFGALAALALAGGAVVAVRRRRRGRKVPHDEAAPPADDSPSLGEWLLQHRGLHRGDDGEPFVPSGAPAPMPSPQVAAVPAAEPAVLHISGGPLIGLRVPVAGRPVTIGTSHDCGVVLPAAGKEVERRHARIWHRDGRYMLHRLGRRGAIVMAGQQVQWAVLEPDDEFAIGPHRFRFQVYPATR